MKQNLLFRVIIIVVITLVALYIVIGPRRTPNAGDFTVAGLQRNLRENIRLGLDLRGGSHLVMRVKVEDYLKRLAEENHVNQVQATAATSGVPLKEVRPDTSGNSYRVIAEVSDPSKISVLRDAISNIGEFQGWDSSVSGNTITWTLSNTARQALADRATDDAMRIIEGRINTIGVAEPLLQRHGGKASNQILLQMPGIEDPERVKALIKGESRLELMKVANASVQQPPTQYNTREEAVAALNAGGNVPSNRRVLEYSERDEPTAAANQTANPADPNKPKRFVVVESPAIVSGEDLQSAAAIQPDGGRENEYEIDFTLKTSGATKFGAWTQANINNYMAVVLNDEVKSMAYIKGRIDNRGQISGSFTKQAADDLALTLRSGALPAGIQYQEERTVGPSLGEASIRAGVTASIAGLILVALFMIIYYRGSGINAIIALVLNLILTLAAMVVFDAALTLTGIAGLVLTIGMAVDSNVLIFERIREEMLTAKTATSSVDQGFARAFVTIIDTHVTTVVSALFLFVFGTSLIRGFAVTLILGLIINLFSAIYVSRTIFIWVLNRRGKQAASISI